jgi:hypothetical protein
VGIELLIPEGLEVSLQEGHTDLAAVLINFVETILDHSPIILGHNDLGNLVEYEV